MRARRAMVFALATVAGCGVMRERTAQERQRTDCFREAQRVRTAPVGATADERRERADALFANRFQCRTSDVTAEELGQYGDEALAAAINRGIDALRWYANARGLGPEDWPHMIAVADAARLESLRAFFQLVALHLENGEGHEHASWLHDAAAEAIHSGRGGAWAAAVVSLTGDRADVAQRPPGAARPV